MQGWLIVIDFPFHFLVPKFQEESGTKAPRTPLMGAHIWGPLPNDIINLWQYGLWSFQTEGIKLERFCLRINNQHTQRKLA